MFLLRSGRIREERKKYVKDDPWTEKKNKRMIWKISDTVHKRSFMGTSQELRRADWQTKSSTILQR